MALRVGASVVVDGRLCDVLGFGPTGLVCVEDVIILELRWYDYFSTEFLDPHDSPEALLVALSLLEAVEQDGGPPDG